VIAPRDVELRHLRYFIALGEERHFGRAARRVFVSQPSLSYAMSQLEERLGCTLIDRSDRRGLRLTPSGEALLAYAREIDRQVDAALRSVQETEQRRTRQLRIGYNDGEPIAQRPSALRSAMRDAALTASFRRLDWGAEATTLRRRAVDVLLARLPIDTAGLEVEVIHTEALKLCVRRDHAIATRRRIKRTDLATLPMVRPVGGSAEWQAFWRGVPVGEGIDGPEVHSPEETFDVVAAGKAGCLVPTSMIVEGDRSAVRYVAVAGLEPSQLAVVWRGRATTDIKAFVAAVRLLAQR
jgi:DNA-binding transcriptional LysR family regulator